MANSTAVTILDGNSSAKTVSTIDAMFTQAGTPSTSNVMTVQPSSAFTVAATIGSSPTINLTLLASVAIDLGSSAVGAGTQRVTLATNSAGVFAAGQTTKSGSTPVTMASDQGALGTVILTPGSTTAGLTATSLIMSTGTNSTLISTQARKVYHIQTFNSSTTIGYLRLYNLSTAPTAGTSTYTAVFMVPGDANGRGFIAPIEMGLNFTTGLGYTFTAGIASTDTTAVGSSQYIVNILYA